MSSWENGVNVKMVAEKDTHHGSNPKRVQRTHS